MRSNERPSRSASLAAGRRRRALLDCAGSRETVVVGVEHKDVTIRRVGFRSGTDAELRMLHAVEAPVEAERRPDREPQPVESYIAFARKLPSQFDDHTWLAQDADGTPVATAACWPDAVWATHSTSSTGRTPRLCVATERASTTSCRRRRGTTSTSATSPSRNNMSRSWTPRSWRPDGSGGGSSSVTHPEDASAGRR